MKPCPPCDSIKRLFDHHIDESRYEIKQFDKDSESELIKVMIKYSMKSVPFAVINDKAIHYKELQVLLRAIKSRTLESVESTT